MSNPIPPPQFEHYRVQTKPDGSLWILGRGGMGVTYRAVDVKLGREVALKVVDSNRLQDDAARQRFLREAKATASLNHRNIAAVFHQGQIGESCYYAMELIEGQTLHQIVKEQGVRALPEALEITRQTAQALSEAEKNGLVHRDIKPANIMLKRESDGQALVKLIDFGLVKAVEDPEATQLTIDGGYLGTAMTSSPEQCRGDNLDTRSDIYSLGIVLWIMIEGRPPFEDQNHFRLMMAQLETPPPFERLPELPGPVMDLLARMLAKRAEDRPQNTAELIAMIDRAVESTRNPEAAPEATFQDPTQLAPRSRTGLHIAIALLVTALAGGGWVWKRHLDAARPATPRPAGRAEAGPGLLERFTSLHTAILESRWSEAISGAMSLIPLATTDDRRRELEEEIETLSQRLLTRPETEWGAALRGQVGAWRAWAEAAPRPAARLALARALKPGDPAAAAALLAAIDSSSLPDSALRLERAALLYLLAADEAARQAPERELRELVQARPAGLEDPVWQRGRVALGELRDAGYVPALLLIGQHSEDPVEAQAVLMDAVQRLDKVGDWRQSLPVFLELVRRSTDARVQELMKERINLLARGFLEQPAGLTDADFTVHRARWEKAATSGSGAAAELLGERLAPADPAAAAGWLARAAAAGSGNAMVSLSRLLEEGSEGLPPDPTKAREWLLKAAQANHPPAQTLLGQRLLAANDPASTTEGLQWLEKAAQRKYGPALLALADASRRGRGQPADPARARKLYQLAIDAGQHQAHGLLGSMLLDGEGGPADTAKAIQHFEAGARHQDPVSQAILGASLLKGNPSAADRSRAVAMLVAAAKAGNREARAYCEQNGISIP